MMGSRSHFATSPFHTINRKNTFPMETGLFKFDKTAFSVGSLDEEPDDLAYWLSKTPDERLAAMELMRQINYDYDPVADRIPRVLEIVERAPR